MIFGALVNSGGLAPHLLALPQARAIGGDFGARVQAVAAWALTASASCWRPISSA